MNERDIHEDGRNWKLNNNHNQFIGSIYYSSSQNLLFYGSKDDFGYFIRANHTFHECMSILAFNQVPTIDDHVYAQIFQIRRKL